MTLWDIKTPDEWQKILDQVSDGSAIHTTLADEEGNILLNGGGYNPLCSRIRANPESLTFVCSQTSTRMFKHARDSEKPCNDFCEIGMFKTVVPIINNGAFIGGLSACGVSIIGDPLEEFLIAKVLDLDETTATELAESVPNASMSELEGISQHFLMLLGYKRSIE